MRWLAFVGAGILAAGTAMTGAQQADTTASRDEVHLTGCITRGAESNSLVLTRAETIGVAKSSDVMPRGTAGTGDEAKTRSYRLSGSSLETLVNHRVQVIGTLVPRKPDDQPSSLTTSSSPMDEVRVKTVTSLADSCS